jgi:hypothetical protein
MAGRGKLQKRRTGGAEKVPDTLPAAVAGNGKVSERVR